MKLTVDLKFNEKKFNKRVEEIIENSNIDLIKYEEGENGVLYVFEYNENIDNYMPIGGLNVRDYIETKVNF